MNWHCVNCNVHTKEIGDYYEVKDGVWPKPLKGCLCIPCLEQRLGRTLTQDDFTDSKRNYFGSKSEILTTRLQASGTIQS